MTSTALREMVWADLLTLPDDAFQTTREFVLFQKTRRETKPAWTDNTAVRPLSAYDAVKKFILKTGGSSDLSTNPAHLEGYGQ